jgi:chromosome segregation protein
VRLSSIKLSGFKSFADPTNFQLPGQLVGVVGPNGCGKSNIMDAVRWVLGESRAAELRGESMQDVIFNGTTSRKAAGRASVELVFDNASHRAGGQWGQYAEVAVRRVLTRDGTSSYFINNQAVRRRDVQDVFLGTGLGPRAYAIIGQGTISRIIESKPEELRLFLEEAAGVSKYKERRRETENRLGDTRENLVRVEDILRELNANLDKLEQQAAVALQYKSLHAEAMLRQQQQWFLKRGQAQGEQERIFAEGQKAVIELESRVADLRHVEAELEVIRQAHYEAGDGVNKAQGLLYEASTEVGKLEAEIRFVVEGRQRVELRLAQLLEQAAQWQARAGDAQHELDNLAATSEEAAEQAELMQAQLDEQSAQTPLLEDALRQAQTKANAERQSVSLVQQQIQVLATEQRHLDEQSRALQLRQERLGAERKALAAPDEAQLVALQEQQAQAQAANAECASQLDGLQTQVPALDDERRAKQNQLQTDTARQGEIAARLDALRSLQDKLKTDTKLNPWLAKHGLEGLPALWTRLHMSKGWENALEAALRERLSALQVGRLDSMGGMASDAPPAKLSFFSTSAVAQGQSTQLKQEDSFAEQAQSPNTPTALASGRSVNVSLGLPPMAHLLQNLEPGQAASELGDVLADWLSGCYTAPSMAEALAARERLAAFEQIYLPSGHAIGRHSISFYAQDSEQAGLLARAQEIENLALQAKAQQLIVDESRSTLVRAETAYTEASHRLAQVRSSASAAQSRAHDAQVALLRLTQQVEQARGRGEQLQQDLHELQASQEEVQERRMAAEERFETLDMQLADTQERHANLDDAVIHAERRLGEFRNQLRGLELQQQEAKFSERSLLLRRQELGRSVETAQQQVLALADERERALQEQLRLSAAAAQGGLQAALSLKLEREAALATRRSDYDGLSTQLRASDERRMQFERSLDPLRQRIGELQLKEQAARLGLEQYQQFLLDANADLDALALSLQSEPVALGALSPQIERLNREIAALGAVNLAALEELGSARERKQFLDAQTADLNEAIDTLESAIKKIDMETRDMLGATFNTVNEHFGRMFPELFGGGQAKLVMTGEEILDAGVQVLAQPPGKKNQTIHLLSGGEKALTAIALVFAIFQLNPAPFCLLDEVDAPLDDANTERYAKLVKTMSQGTQFLFISHNKIAMEMAEQLIGVTMQEQGVSRIVAVDMEAALSLNSTTD